MKSNKHFSFTTDAELLELLKQQEPQANRVIARILLGCAIVYVICWALIMFGMFQANHLLVSIVLLGGAAACSAAALISYRTNGEYRYLRQMMLGVLLFYTFTMNLCLGYKFTLYYAFPIVLSCRYYRTRTVRDTALIAGILIFISCFTNVYFSDYTGVPDLNSVYFGEDVTLHVKHMLYEAVLQADTANLTNVELTMLQTTLPNILILAAVAVACWFIVMHNQKLLVQISESKKEIARVELERAALEVQEADTRKRIMISQIGPHFLYNSLSAIMAIDGNPEETVNALGNFAKYLREDLDVLTSGALESFSKEIQHVRRYLSLEQLRFGDKVQVTYDIQARDFMIPPLSVQMLAENAVKHGLTPREGGGTITIHSEDRTEEYLVMVTDDGVGFVPEELPEGAHIGIENVRFRLQSACHGTLEIQSRPGAGTTAIIRIPKA